MSTLLAILALAVVTTAWFLLALAPALGELLRRTDVEPLRLRRGGGDVRHFALGFQRFVDAELDALRNGGHREVPASGHAVRLRGGEPGWHIPRRRAAIMLPLRQMPADALATHVVLSEEELTVPNESALLKELYVARDLRGGNDCFYRAVLARGHASLGARSGVLRWIDVGGVLVVAEGSVLYGRASAKSQMRLYDGVTFQRIAAPSITFGTPRGAPRTSVDAPRAAMHAERAPLEPPKEVTESFGRWLVEGDFELPAGAYVAADLIVGGTLRVGAGARVGGAVKSAVLVGEERVTFDGAIVATSRLELGDGSVVAGPVVVEGEASVGAESRVGTVAEPTTISAVSVRVGAGTVVCGEVWARTTGSVEGPAVPRELSSGGWQAVTSSSR